MPDDAPKSSPPPDEVTLPGDQAAGDCEIVVRASADGGLIFKQGLRRMDLTAAASLRLLRWMIWHALHGRWAPRQRY